MCLVLRKIQCSTIFVSFIVLSELPSMSLRESSYVSRIAYVIMHMHVNGWPVVVPIFALNGSSQQSVITISLYLVVFAIHIVCKFSLRATVCTCVPVGVQLAKLTPSRALLVNLATMLTLTMAAALKLPVSTTHVAVSA